MLFLTSLFNRILILLLIVLSFSQQTFGQKSWLEVTPLRDNWKIEVKTGFATLLSEIPDKYLGNTNYLNIPVNVPGLTSVFSFKKGVTPHFEMGWQFDYIRIQGDVIQDNKTYNVLTQAIGYNYIISYNLKRMDIERPLLNYFLSYKIGAVELKNNPKEIKADGSQVNGKFIDNIGIITGFELGVNYQYKNNLSFVGTIDLKRSSDPYVSEDIYKFYKIFYTSETTINNYATLTLGLRYTFNFSNRKTPALYNPYSTENERRPKSKIYRKKRKGYNPDLPTWYDRKQGK